MLLGKKPTENKRGHACHKINEHCLSSRPMVLLWVGHGRIRQDCSKKNGIPLTRSCIISGGGKVGTIDSTTQLLLPLRPRLRSLRSLSKKIFDNVHSLRLSISSSAILWFGPSSSRFVHWEVICTRPPLITPSLPSSRCNNIKHHASPTLHRLLFIFLIPHRKYSNSYWILHKPR